MKLRTTLAELARVVADEAERNPDFAQRINATLRHAENAVGARPTVSSFPALQRRAQNRRATAVFDPVIVAREGEHVLRVRLAELSLQQLRDIVAEYGMDPGKLVLKWKSPEKVIERIVQISIPRSQKGDAFRAESSAPRRRPMSLKRLNNGYAIDLEGVAFGMLDDRGNTVRCLVTGDALTDAIGGNPSQKEQVEWFVSNRSIIEQVASVKFDQGAIENNGAVRVGTRDLSPHLFHR
jgi:uncharacterized protein DUF1488